MRFLVIGHCAFDVFHSPDGSDTEVPGGILHAVRTIAQLAGKGDVVLPVFGIHQDDRSAIQLELEQFPSVDTSGLYGLDQPTNRVHYYQTQAGRAVACPKDIAPPIPPERIKRFLDVNGVLVNMISGSDITLDTLDQIRMANRSEGIPLHFDYHNLTLGVTADHERYRRPIPDWRRWAFMVDTVQLNEEELAGLSVDRMPEDQTVGHLLTLSVKAVLVTRGAHGVTLFRNEQKHVQREDLDALPVDGHLDRVGSGDVFGAAFHFHYVKTSNLRASAEAANRFAALHGGAQATGGRVASDGPEEIH